MSLRQLAAETEAWAWSEPDTPGKMHVRNMLNLFWFGEKYAVESWPEDKKWQVPDTEEGG